MSFFLPVKIFSQFLPKISILVLGLIISLSVTSKYDVHPDENKHALVINYFIDHNTYPKVGDEKSLYTYSEYGYSYIDEYDIVYYLAGKFYTLSNKLWTEEYMGFRFFQILLFLFLLIYFSNKKDGSIFLAFLLLTPQLWYIFSYGNGDAFPFFLSFLAAYQVTSPRSAFANYLRQTGFKLSFHSNPIFFSLLVAGLFLSKKNYWIFIIFLGTLLCIQLIPHFKKEFLQKVFLVLVISIIFIAPRILNDVVVNGWNKTALRIEVADRIADDRFKPNMISSNLSFRGLKLKNKGIPIQELISIHKWHYTSFDSFVGVYNHMNLLGSKVYYDIMFFFYFFLVSFLLNAYILKNSKISYFKLLLGILFVFFVLGISLYHSWTGDFQPQGRYLFPIIGILAVLGFEVKEQLNRYFYLTIFVISILGLYSFIFVALKYLPKS